MDQVLFDRCLAYFSTLKMEVLCSSETFINFFLKLQGVTAQKTVLIEMSLN
jgi:hypothetical protein